MRKAQCTGSKLVFPWKISQALTKSIFLSNSVHLQLIFYSADDNFNTSFSGLTIFNKTYRTLDFSQYITSPDFELSSLTYSFVIRLIARILLNILIILKIQNAVTTMFIIIHAYILLNHCDQSKVFFILSFTWIF